MPSRNSQATIASGVSRIGRRREVVIPQDILDDLHLQEGDLVEVRSHRGRVTLQPKLAAGSDETLAPTEAKKVRVGLQEMKKGKTMPWSQVKRELGL
jgi:AbrB family looped-hinge helix DNA binding protein